MDNNENDKLLDHEYDGIQELDNNLPLWWLWTFFAAIIFSFIYWIHYSFSGDGPSLDQELDAGMAKIERQRSEAAKQGAGTEVTPEQLAAKGKELFMVNCSSCHKADGGGSVGPNLTDGFWIHGNTSEDITQVVQDGVLAKGMPPWKDVLKPGDIQSVVAFIETMKNTNVKNGKAPQGEKVE